MASLAFGPSSLHEELLPDHEPRKVGAADGEVRSRRRLLLLQPVVLPALPVLHVRPALVLVAVDAAAVDALVEAGEEDGLVVDARDVRSPTLLFTLK